MVGDAHEGLEFLRRDSRIDRKRVALLRFVSGVPTATLLADTREARNVFASKDTALFRAFFAFSPVLQPGIYRRAAKTLPIGLCQRR
jgi:hypothetical protein